MICLSVSNKRDTRSKVSPITRKSNQFSDVPRIVYREVTNYDENGEIVTQARVRNFRRNKGGFIMMYTAKMDEFIKNTSTPAILRVFMYLANHQGYGIDGVFGYRCSRQHICDALKITRKSVYSALEYLIDQFLVNEIRIAGVYEYMVNPAYVSVGSNANARKKEWNQRWEFYWKRKHAGKSEFPKDIVVPEVDFNGEEKS